MNWAAKGEPNSCFGELPARGRASRLNGQVAVFLWAILEADEERLIVNLSVSREIVLLPGSRTQDDVLRA